jgi:hypothetical protein
MEDLDRRGCRQSATARFTYEPTGTPNNDVARPGQPVSGGARKDARERGRKG